MEYEVILVKGDSDHDLARYVEDEEELFIVYGLGNWYRAADFFLAHDIKKFKAID